MNKPIDRLGKEIKLNDLVLRAVQHGKSPALNVCLVTKVEGSKVWLDGSPAAIIFNDRLAVCEEPV
jgi:hypothetical protein